MVQHSVDLEFKAWNIFAVDDTKGFVYSGGNDHSMTAASRLSCGHFPVHTGL